MTGGVDSFARFLFYTALFFLILLLSLYRKFLSLRFFLSWWAYSFPVAAFTIASMVMYQQLPSQFLLVLSGFMLALLTLIIGVLAVNTLLAVKRGQICVED
jgi:tellurite resistance protein